MFVLVLKLSHGVSPKPAYNSVFIVKLNNLKQKQKALSSPVTMTKNSLMSASAHDIRNLKSKSIEPWWGYFF
jgi:hypothetical protein